MPPDPAPIAAETLLEHQEWVRALARSLTADPHDAADLEQQTWLTALDRPPADQRALRGWLGAVARSLVRRRYRRDVTARRGLAAVEASVPAPGAAELTARAEIHGLVVQAVLGLREPYREVILLRYFEGLRIKEVAARAGVPLETARARLRRAKAMLRVHLERTAGGDRGWRLALAPLVSLPRSGEAGAGAAAAATGGALVGSKIAVCAVVVCVALGGWVVLGDRVQEESPPVTAAASSDAVPDAAAPSEPAARDRRESAQEPDTRAGAALPGDADAPPLTFAERLDAKLPPVQFNGASLQEACGRISSLAGIPIAISTDVMDSAQLKSMRVTLSLGGEFSSLAAVEILTSAGGLGYALEEERVVITREDVEWDSSMSAVLAPPYGAGTSNTLELRGRVVDADGNGVGDARIENLTYARETLATTAEDGSFAIEVHRPFPRILAAAPGHVASLVVKLETSRDADPEELVLALRGRASTVSVRATDEDGTPIPEFVATFRAEKYSKRRDLVAHTAEGAHRIVIVRRATAQEEVVCDELPPVRTIVTVAGTGFEEHRQRVDVTLDSPLRLDVQLVRTADIERRARKRVSITVTKLPLVEAVAELARASDERIELDAALPAERRFELVTLEAEDQSLPRVLHRLCRAAGGLRYEIRARGITLRDADE